MRIFVLEVALEGEAVQMIEMGRPRQKERCAGPFQLQKRMS